MVIEEGMMSAFRTFLFCFSLSLLGSGLVWAEEASGPTSIASQEPPFDFSKLKQYIPDIYPAPQTPTANAGDSIKTCVAIDDEIVTLLPLTYRTVPDFYDDPKVAAAIWLTTTGITLFDFFPDDLPLTRIPLGYSLLAYPEYKKYNEEKRIRLANLRIESLRRTKARMRCFET